MTVTPIDSHLFPILNNALMRAQLSFIAPQMYVAKLSRTYVNYQNLWTENIITVSLIVVELEGSNEVIAFKVIRKLRDV